MCKSWPPTFKLQMFNYKSCHVCYQHHAQITPITHISCYNQEYKIGSNMYILCWWIMIIWVSVVLRRTVCDDIDWCFDNLRGSPHQSSSQVVETSVNVMTVLLRTTLTQTIIIHRPMIWFLGSNHLQHVYLLMQLLCFIRFSLLCSHIHTSIKYFIF